MFGGLGPGWTRPGQREMRPEKFSREARQQEAARRAAEALAKAMAERNKKLAAEAEKEKKEKAKREDPATREEPKPFPSFMLPTDEKNLPIPAVPFGEKAFDLGEIYKKPLKIYVTPTQYFEKRVENVFIRARLPKVDQYDDRNEVRKWSHGPNMSYWPQQLNFATWCATTGCGVSREIFDEENSSFKPPRQLRSLYVFHVYYTVRRILFQLEIPMPKDKLFSIKNNKYNQKEYEKICREFEISTSSDFRYTGDLHHGREGAFADIWHRHESPQAGYGYSWFCPNHSTGLTSAGLARINNSIEAFVICVLGAQAEMRSSIIGKGGRAESTQFYFLKKMNDIIAEKNPSVFVSKYQKFIQATRVQLNLAVCPGAWLLPGRMIINTKSVYGYNNELQQATAGMSMGINDDLNKEKKITPAQGDDDDDSPDDDGGNAPGKQVEPSSQVKPVKNDSKGSRPSTPKKPETPQEPTKEMPHEEKKLIYYALGLVAAYGVLKSTR